MRRTPSPAPVLSEAGRRRARRWRPRPGAPLAAVALATVLAASCRAMIPVKPSVVPSLPPAPALESLVPAPVLRVGILTEVARASVGADSGVRVLGLAPGFAWTGRTAAVSRATFVLAPAVDPARRFRVEVGSRLDMASAQDVARRAQAAAGLVPGVRASPETGLYQVRVGELPTAGEAASLAASLSRAGLKGAAVVDEPPAERGRLSLLETGEEFQAVTIVPSQAGEGLVVDSLPYRGLVEVRPGVGGLTVVNVVNLEDYLKGVVPNELSPQAFPQIEALKAQAVAARTYALRNRGQFQQKGYDICATPSCQVYRGRASEDPLSSRAVDETRGIAAFYQGALINALYASTCGGHTEDGDRMFEGEAAPYLRGVECVPERSAWATIRTLASPRVLGDEDSLNRDAALLVSLGVLEPRYYARPALTGAPTSAELRAWTTRLLLALHRTGCDVRVAGSLIRRGTFLRSLVGALCWDERAERLLAPSDPDYLLQVEDRADLTDPEEKKAVALLVSEAIVSPSSDNRLHVAQALTRAQAVGILARAALRAGTPELLTAEFRGAEGGAVSIKRGESTDSLPLDPQVRLFRDVDGARAAASEVSLAAGEKVSLVQRGGRVVFLEAQQSRMGAAADHASRYYRWEVRLTPAEVESGLARFGSVGAIRDVLPRRIGVSGRVVELAFLGSGGELVLKGLKIRSALGLRENLFVVDRERGPTGRVERFVFTGKGWGHGVGLCQVGSFGMAQAGSTYEEILKHYYTGITLEALTP